MTVTGVDDSVADGDVAYTIVTARRHEHGCQLQRAEPADVAVTNTDNDIGGDHGQPDIGPGHDRGGRHGDLHRRAQHASRRRT